MNCVVRCDQMQRLISAALERNRQIAALLAKSDEERQAEYEVRKAEVLRSRATSIGKLQKFIRRVERRVRRAVKRSNLGLRRASSRPTTTDNAADGKNGDDEVGSNGDALSDTDTIGSSDVDVDADDDADEESDADLELPELEDDIITVFWSACIIGDSLMVQQCIKDGILDMDTKFAPPGDTGVDEAYTEATPFLVAAIKGHAPIVELLLAAGADRRARNAANSNAWELAAQRGHSHVIRTLERYERHELKMRQRQERAKSRRMQMQGKKKSSNGNTTPTATGGGTRTAPSASPEMAFRESVPGPTDI